MIMAACQQDRFPGIRALATCSRVVKVAWEGCFAVLWTYDPKQLALKWLIISGIRNIFITGR